MRLPLLLLMGLPLLLLPAPASSASLGGEFIELEGYVGRHPRDRGARLRLADTYAARGFVEEAMAQYLVILKTDGGDGEATAGAMRLVQQQMPAWLPAEAEAAPFTRAALHLSSAPGEAAGPPRLLLTTSLAAPAGGKHDRLHGWLYSWIIYGYLWDESQHRWLIAARAHYAVGAEVAQATLHTVLALSLLVSERLQPAPTHDRPPLDIWLAEKGEPGARTVGRDIYLYAVGVDRAPEEWLREVTHEYGHAALPGLGGFTNTDDPWADGELGEVLFAKWLAAAQVEHFPWPASAAEALARSARARLLARAPKPDPKLLAGADAAARDHLVGLALRVEATAGPRFLGEVLARCPRGRATQFVQMAEGLAKERGVRLW